MKRENTIFTFALAITTLYQVACTMQGFDLTDEGALLSTYQWFGVNPLYAKCGTGYPLSSYLGWLIMSLYPQGGILWVRLCGVLLVTLTEIIVYSYLRTRVKPNFLIFGLSIITIFLAGDPKPLGYNNVTAFFAVIIVMLAINASLCKHKAWLFVMSGLLGGLCVFVRLPNVTFVALAVLPFIANCERGIFSALKNKNSYIHATVFILSFFAGCFVGWILVDKIGASNQIIEFFTSVSGQLEGESTHGFSAMLGKYIENYILAIYYPIVFLLCICVLAKAIECRSRIVLICVLTLVFLILYRLMYFEILGGKIVAMINGIGLYGCSYYIYKGGEMRVVAAGALLMSLLAPLGSDLGFMTMWVGAWMSFPVGLLGCWNIIIAIVNAWPRKIHLHLENSVKTFAISVSVRKVSKLSAKYAYCFCAFVILVTTIIKIDHKAYYDPGNRNEKIYTIESSLAQHIYTHKYKADIVNPLLKALKYYVSPGDNLLVFNFSPLINYLTETKPYAGISWPCVYFGERYVIEVEKEFAKGEKKPVIVLQHFNCCNQWNLKTKGYLFGDKAFDRLQSKRMKKWLNIYKYQRVWSNGYYEILVSDAN